MKRQRNTAQIKEQTRNTKVQINEEEISKLPVGSSFLMRDQALSLWSGSTDSKTLDYQRVNPKEYQTVRTPMKEITCIQDQASPNHQ